MMKRLFLFLMLFLPLLAMTQNVNLNNGLVAYYPFDGNAKDASGKGNTGDVRGATLARGVKGQCYHFGGYNNPQIIRIPNCSQIQFTTAASFSFWFKLDDYVGMDGWGKKLDGGCMMFFAKDFDRGQICSSISGNGNNSFRVGLANNGQGCDAVVEGNATRQWYHAVMVVTTSYMKIYINGKLVAQKNANTTFDASNSRDLYIGRLSHTWYPFHGCMDEFCVYNRALTSEDVNGLYSGQDPKSIELRNEALTASNQPLSKILDYKDYKFLDDEPDYLLYRANDDFNGYTYCETTKKLYTLDNGYDNCEIREYDLSNALNPKVRSFTLPFGVDISSITIDNSPDGKTLAIIDKEGKFLHIVDAASGAETAKAKLGKKYPYTVEGKHCFAFQSNDEIVVIGKETALLYNFTQKRAKPLSNGEVSYFRWVDHNGRIRAYVNGEDGTYNIEKGELRNFQKSRYYNDIANVVGNFSLVKDKKDITYIDNRTGQTVSRDVAYSDGKKYTIIDNTIFNPDNGAGIEFDGNGTWWMDNGRLLCVMDKDRNEFSGFRIYNHTLTDNEIEKQKLRVIIEKRKDKNLLAEYIKDHPNSQYLPIARQKMWDFLSSPNDFSAEHIAEVQNYIKDYGNTVNADAAKAELNSLYLKNLENIGVNDFVACESYISQFPESPYIDQARAKQKEAYRIEYETFCSNTNAQPYLDYAARYPKSPYADAARERARQILAEEERQRQEAEELKREYDKAMNLFEKKQYAAAMPLIQKLANKGNDNMQCKLGYMYDIGLGVKEDDAEAVKWYRKSAEQGFAAAQYKLGYMYDTGRGVTMDIAKAVEWYKKAAEGNAEGQYRLGRMYDYGWGVKEDDTEAVKWYRKSAEQGLKEAQNNLGYMYENGYGVKEDDEEAVKWFRKAAEQGGATAQSNLGLMYEYGDGVKKDEEEAVKWFRKAANQGNSIAKKHLVLLEGPANAVKDFHKWSMGKQVCVRYNGGILLGYVEKFNENRSSAQIKVVAGPSGEYKGQTLKKNGLIWIEKGAGWHLAVQEEISYANSHNKLKEEGSGQTTTKTKDCFYKTGDKVRREYTYSHVFGIKWTDLICGVIIAVDDDCHYTVLIQSIYDGKFKDPQKAKTRTDNRKYSVGDTFGAYHSDLWPDR